MISDEGPVRQHRTEDEFDGIHRRIKAKDIEH